MQYDMLIEPEFDKHRMRHLDALDVGESVIIAQKLDAELLELPGSLE